MNEPKKSNLFILKNKGSSFYYWINKIKLVFIIIMHN